ncbi:hypothetical protein VTI74DRAFT_6843 [Chaetomium olivicolor]
MAGERPICGLRVFYGRDRAPGHLGATEDLDSATQTVKLTQKKDEVPCKLVARYDYFRVIDVGLVEEPLSITNYLPDACQTRSPKSRPTARPRQFHHHR